MNYDNLSQYFNRIDLIKDTANQIIKDFVTTHQLVLINNPIVTN